MPTEQEHSNSWCCIDCLMWLANGETPPELDEEETQKWKENFWKRNEGYELTLGRMFGEDGCEHTHEDWDEDSQPHALECEQIEFSWSQCDTCGSNLGGERGAVTFWWDKEEAK